MAQDPKLTREKLSKLWKDPNLKTLELTGKKYAIISDLHLGDGGGADNFRYNENALKSALSKYLKNGYEIILLGDIEEFWQFDLEGIRKKYDPSVYKALRKFGDDKIHRIYGNHDDEWSSPQDPAKSVAVRAKEAEEAVRLKNTDDSIRVFLIHGHQGSVESDKGSWFSRFFVKLYGSTIEPLIDLMGFRQEPSATKSQIAKDYEKIMYLWAKKNKTILICGHSHRAIFASQSYIDKMRNADLQLDEELHAIKKDFQSNVPLRDILRRKRELEEKINEEKAKGRDIVPLEESPDDLVPCYFNSGCGLYTDGLTAIEIEENEIRLVKWTKEGVKDGAFDSNQGNLAEYMDHF